MATSGTEIGGRPMQGLWKGILPNMWLYTVQ